MSSSSFERQGSVYDMDANMLHNICQSLISNQPNGMSAVFTNDPFLEAILSYSFATNAVIQFNAMVDAEGRSTISDIHIDARNHNTNIETITYNSSTHYAIVTLSGPVQTCFTDNIMLQHIVLAAIWTRSNLEYVDIDDTGTLRRAKVNRDLIRSI